MVPASPVLIPCFRELDSRFQSDDGDGIVELAESGTDAFEDAMQEIIFGVWRGNVGG
jgi:hypothetical protein